MYYLSIVTRMRSLSQLVAEPHPWPGKREARGRGKGRERGAFRYKLLPLVRHLDVVRSKRHARCVLLGRDGAMLGLVLDEGDAATPRNETHLAEALEAPKEGSERVHIVVVGQVLHEQDLVRRQVLVGYDGCRGGRRLEAPWSAAARCSLPRRGARRQVSAGPCLAGALEPLLFLGCFERLLLVCAASAMDGVRGGKTPVCFVRLTLFCKPPSLVLLKLLLCAYTLYRGIASRPGKCDLHRFVEDLKALRLFDGGAR